VGKINKSDEEVFREEMSAVRRLKPDNRHRQPASKPKIMPATRSYEQALDEDMGIGLANAPVGLINDETGQPVSFLREGLPRKYFKRLGTRQCPVADSFDLHGLNEATAKKALKHFLAESIAHGLECIRVVHGKGLRSDGPPVLKLMTWKMLQNHPAVRALKPCAPADGGSGAVLVLLRIDRRLAE
jgi:DNA-nicking Smr family endonuclease